MSAFRSILLIFLFFLALIAKGQIIDAAMCDTAGRYTITQYSSLLKTNEPVTIDAVLKLRDNFTRVNDKPVLVLNYEPYYYWFRFIIKNPQPNNRDLALFMAPVGMRDGRLFQKKDDKWTQIAVSGTTYKLEDRSYPSTHYVFPFTVQPGLTDTLYLSVDARNVYKSFGFALLNIKAVKTFEHKIYFVFGIIIGLLLLFLILNLSLYFVLSEKLHLWYALYIFLVILIVIKNDQLDQEFLGLDSELGFRLTPYASIGCLAISILMHVVQNFLNPVLIHNRRLYLITKILKINLIVSAVIHAIVFITMLDYRLQNIIFFWTKVNIFIGVCMILIDCLYCARRGFKRGLFIFFGSLVFLIGSVQRLYFPSTLSFLFPPTTFHIGIILEVLVISFALAYSYWTEKELQREREEQLRIQITQDISDEIHDNVGQMLTLARLYLKTLIDPEKYASQKITDAESLVGKAIVELRDLSRGLKDQAAFQLNMTQQIETECKRLEKAGVFKVNLKISGGELQLDNRKQAMIIRMVREAIQNIIKHSQATKVDIYAHFKRHSIYLRIEDNGIGFDVYEAELNGNGLKNIKNRCSLLNGTCKFSSIPAHGTQISIRIPIINLIIQTKASSRIDNQVKHN